MVGFPYVVEGRLERHSNPNIKIPGYDLMCVELDMESGIYQNGSSNTFTRQILLYRKTKYLFDKSNGRLIQKVDNLVYFFAGKAISY